MILSGKSSLGWRQLFSEDGSSTAQFTMTAGGSWVSSGGVLHCTDDTSATFGQEYLDADEVLVARMLEAEIRFPAGGSGTKHAGVYMGAQPGTELSAGIEVGPYGLAMHLKCDYAGPTLSPAGAVLEWNVIRLVATFDRVTGSINGLVQAEAPLGWVDPGTSTRTYPPIQGGWGIYAPGSGADHQPQFRNIQGYAMVVRLP